MRTGLGFLFLRKQRQHFLSLPSFFQPADPLGRDTGLKPSPDARPSRQPSREEPNDSLLTKITGT